MNLIELGVLLIALSVYSLWFITNNMRVHFYVLIPFLNRIHSPNAMSVITDEEHDVVHDRSAFFELQVRSCNWATAIAVTAALVFYAFQLYGGTGTIFGYIMAIAFAYIGANYNIGKKTMRWCAACENQVLARIMDQKREDGGFDTLGDYLQAENAKMIQEWTDEVIAVGEEFEARLKELGYDEDYDYMQNPADEEKLMKMLAQVQEEIEEKYPNRP